MVGERSALRVNGDVRFFADSHIDRGAALRQRFMPGEGGLVSVQEGAVAIDREIDGEKVAANRRGATVLVPSADRDRSFVLTAAEDSRVIRVTHGPGEGFVVDQPLARR